MASLLRRHVVTITHLKSGIERRATVSVWVVLAVFAAVLALPLLIAFGVAWKATIDVQGLHARYRALAIETANYRAAVDALLGQIGSQPSTGPDPGDSARITGAPQSPRLDSAAATHVVHPRPDSLAPATPAENPGSDAAAAAPASLATDGGSGADTAVAGQAASDDTLDVGQAPAPGEPAGGPEVSSPSYRANGMVGLEAQERPSAGSQGDDLIQPVEADARLPATDIEAPAHAAASERPDVGDPPIGPARSSLAEAGTASTQPIDSPREESRVPVPAAVQTMATVEDTLRDVIAQYVSGLENRNLAALKRVWPSLGGSQERAIQTEFANARTVQTLFTHPRITINGDTTTVTGFRTYNLVTHDGQRLSSVTRTTMTLRRYGNAWVIERVEHQQ